MKILVISFFDDNFGDMLIRVCFDRLLRTAIKNLGVSDDGYEVSHVHIKDAAESDVRDSSAVFFAGGAMLGMNNLSTFGNIDLITAAADKYGVPVVFSSIGINNFYADADSAAQVNAVMSRKCVRAMSTREDPAVFGAFTEGCAYAPVKVCDPAVWVQTLYAQDAEAARIDKPERVIGINLVRGGLFRANGRNWTLSKQERYMNALRELCVKAGYRCRFFTNGSILDNNSLAHFAESYNIPRDEAVYPDRAREVVSAIAGCDAIVAVRMHASIISYSLGVPSLNLVWNEKIPHFYEAIGYPDRAVDPDRTEPQMLFEQAAALMEDHDYRPDPEYMMTLYQFLLRSLREVLGLSVCEPYSFDTVRALLAEMPAGDDEDVTDYRIKLRRARHCYTKLFEKDLEKRDLIRDQEKQLGEQEKQIKEEKSNTEYYKKKLAVAQDELKATQKQVKELRSQLDYIYSKPLVKLYRKMRGTDKKDSKNSAK